MLTIRTFHKKNIFTVLALFISAFYWGQSETPKLKITHLMGDFFVFTTYNTYKGQLTSSNGLYMLTEKGAVMIDTPWDTTQFQPLLDSIKTKHNKSVVLCIATHSHKDRTAGLEFYKRKGIKTYTSKQTDEICKEQGEKRAEFYFARDTSFKIGNYSFQTFYGGEGHTKDNIIIWFDKDKILYGGCAIKSFEATDLGYIREANLKAWPLTLMKVKQKFPDYKFVIPGHQDWSSVKSIDHTLELLKKNKK